MDFYEAQATDKLNRVMVWFQVLFVAFAVGQIIVGIGDWSKILWAGPLILGAGGLCWIWLCRQRALSAPGWMVKLKSLGWRKGDQREA